MSVVITVNGVNIDINTDDEDTEVGIEDEPISVPLPYGYGLLAPTNATNATISAVALAAAQAIVGHWYAQEFFKARCEEAEDDCDFCQADEDDN